MAEEQVRGLAGHLAEHPVPAEEVRFCVVLNGGVSLAVWMGGAVVELDRLVKAGRGAEGDPAYALLLRLAGASARTDVMAGTSAGGINGAALALAQVNRRARLATLRDVWLDQGQLETLLRQPFRGAPASLMRGDEYFLPELNRALRRMAVPCDPVDPVEAPIDLTVATTVLTGNQLVTTDALGQRLPQELHAARLRWSRWPVPEPDARTGAPRPDPFAPARIVRTADELALAARASASFPVAFEPTFLPVDERDSRRSVEDRTVRPSLSGAVEAWGDRTDGLDHSRFAVDGGLLANTPTEYALRAIQAMPASGPVRRVMLLVYPHAPSPAPVPGDRFEEPPTIRETMAGLLGALTAQGGRTFVEEIEAHNRAAAGRRGTRTDVLATIDDSGGQTLESLAAELFPHYRRLRKWRAARDLSARRSQHLVGMTTGDGDLLGWSFERIRAAAEAAQEWLDERDVQDRVLSGSSITTSAREMPAGLPYVPGSAPREAAPDVGPGWAWGVTTAKGVADAVADLLRRLVWVLPPGPAYDTVTAARNTVSTTATRIGATRGLTDDRWDEEPVLCSLAPDESYWAFRLGCYAVLMAGADPAGLAELAGTMAAAEGNHTWAVTRDADAQDRRRTEVLTALQAWLAHVSDPANRGSAGAAVRILVDEVVGALHGVVPVLRAVVDRRAGREGTMAADPSLAVWRSVMAPGDEDPGPDRLLVRLLQLEVATTALGEEVLTGAGLPVELVQLSAQVANPSTRYTRTADDKLGGMAVMRFGGFLKRSWRVNDWMWGRIDAATVLALTVLQPARVRRAALLSGYLDGLSAERTPAALATATVAEVVDLLFAGSPLLADPRLADLRDRAVEELTPCFDLTGRRPGDLATSLPALAALLAWAVHEDVVVEDAPALVRAVQADGVDGSSTRSNGVFFCAQNEALLGRVTKAVDAERPRDVDRADRAQLLAAFDRAGIGRESLEGEVSSDLLLRSAATTAAVGATALDSPRSGLGALRPVTRTLRGAMLVVFWGMRGLTSDGRVARGLALLGLALGGVLVALAVLGALPSAVAAPAALVGVSVLLLSFTYGALRSGTVLHSLVLLTPVVPLLAVAFEQVRTPGETGDRSTHGLLVVGAVLLVALGLMALGTLPAAVGSPYAVLGGLATRMGVPPVDEPDASLLRHLWTGSVRRLKGIGLALGDLGWRLALVAAPLLLAWWVLESGWEQAYAWLRGHATLVLVAATVVGVVGVAVSVLTSFALQGLVGARDGDRVTWLYPRVTHPAGVQAGWSAVYGCVYLALAVLLVEDPWEWGATAWARALCGVALLLGVVLCLLVPVVVPLRAVARARSEEVARAGTAAAFVATAADLGRDDVTVTPGLSYALDLAQRDRAFRWWVADGRRTPERVPVLRRRGQRVLARVDRARDLSGPRS